jgi:hypothetical protein
MNRKDFQDWKQHPITHALFNQLTLRIRGLETELGYQAGDNTRLDAMKVGAIQAFRDVLDADWFEETDK